MKKVTFKVLKKVTITKVERALKFNKMYLCAYNVMLSVI